MPRLSKYVGGCLHPASNFVNTITPITLDPTLVDSSSTVCVPIVISTDSATQSESTAYRRSELPPVTKTAIWGVEFAHVDMQQVIDRADQIIQERHCKYFVTANLNYLMLTEQVPALATVNAESDLNIADGYPIVWRSRLHTEPLPGRVAGSDMIVELARLAAERGYRIFFLGAAPGVAAKAAARLQSMFPQLQVAGCYAPPFRKLEPAEHDEMLEMIRESRADILLVAFGQPKGELWIHENYQRLGTPLSIQLGASFDFLAGTARRAPEFWQAIGCEWLYRSLCEPKRLAPRYLRNIAFLFRSIVRDMLGK